MQLEVLRNLRPETIIAIDDVSFSVLAQSLPDVLEASCCITDVDRIDASNDGDTDPIDIKEAIDRNFDLEERMVVTARYVVVGGLCYDHDCSNPLEDGCADGNIVTDDEAKTALGLDSYGKPDLNLDEVSEELAQRVCAWLLQQPELVAELDKALQALNTVSGPNAVQLSVTEAIRREGWEQASNYLADFFFGHSYLAKASDEEKAVIARFDDVISEGAAEAAWSDACAKGLIGKPMAVPLRKYEHSGVRYDIASDRDGCDACWLPDNEAEENICDSVQSALGIGTSTLYSAGWNWFEAVLRVAQSMGHVLDTQQLRQKLSAQARKYSTGIIEEYNSWLAGDVYGVCCYVIDRRTGERIAELTDECWGFIGSEFAASILQHQMLSAVLHLTQSPH